VAKKSNPCAVGICVMRASLPDSQIASQIKHEHGASLFEDDSQSENLESEDESD
jgi:hypothetical protein